jgi:hypothetical protein
MLKVVFTTLAASDTKATVSGPIAESVSEVAISTCTCASSGKFR